MSTKLRIIAAMIPVIGLIAIIGAGMLIRRSAKGRTYSDVSSVPYRRVGVVLGCSRHLSDGRANLFFSYRILAAAELFKAKKVDYLIASGDNHTVKYDEATAMKDALVAAGVPVDRIYCDFAGFRTLDSIVRAKEVFGQSSMTIVSQKFHNQRAIYIAGDKGIDAIGFNAREVSSYRSLRTKFREQLARVKAVLDVSLLRTQPKFLGPEIVIGESAPSTTLKNRRG
ncbi:MAG: ElyC/SanA/YdcF family protein [Kiritimatiellia bacterium]|nr:ElyC/SanA/YdcF family protein [Kiritimatiellia bacterium]